MRIRALARRLTGASLLAIAAAGSAHAAALEQVVPATIRLLYQEGRYAEFGVSYTDPHQSGDSVTLPPNPILPDGGVLPGNTGNLLDSRWSFSGAYKADLNDRLSYAIGFDQPYAAKTTYGAGTFPALPPAGNTIYQGSSADLSTYQISAAMAYDVNPSIKVFGGVRAQRLAADASISFVDNYSIDADEDWGYGWLVGAAYERPEIALRVSLTYNSKIGHTLDTTETTNTTGAVDGSTDVDTPQSVALDFQTGVAPKTLVFGSVRWVDWSEFNISPAVYGQAVAGLVGTTRPLVDYNDDWWTYTLGVGRQLTDQLAGSFSVTYEPDVGGEMTSLGPTDGRTSATASLSYEFEQITVSGGISYGTLGDTYNVLQTDFNDGYFWGAGLRVGYTF